MKTTVTLFLAALAMLASQSVFADSVPTKDVVIAINDVFVPGGFDSETDAYVVVSGIFPNSCYRWKSAEVSHLDRHEHEITPVASVSQGMCLMVLVPFSKDIKLGKLETGRHTLRFVSGDGTYLEKNTDC